MVRAKFKVDSIEKMVGSKPDRGIRDERGYEKRVACEMATIKMSPVYSSDPGHENKQFWEASPGGQLSLTCVNAAAVAQFHIGQEFYLDFTPAGDPPKLV